jgi:hypothetical protein
MNSQHKLLSQGLIDQSAKQVIIHVFYNLNLIPTHIDREIVRKNKKSLNYTDLPPIFHWDSVAPAFSPSAAHTRLINRPIRSIPTPHSLIFAAPKLISPEAEADREDLGPEWTQGITGLLCRRFNGCWAMCAYFRTFN